MKSRKKWLKRLIAWVIVLAALACLVIFVGIPLYTTKESGHDEPVVYHYEDDGKPLKMETDALLFELDPKTTHFTLTQKESGRTWTDVPAGGGNDPKAQERQKQVLQSNLVVYYKTQVGASDNLNSYKFAIENGNYTVEQLADGGIAVHYSIGRIDKIYIIPEAIPVETYKFYLDQLDGKDQRKVSPSYVLYDRKKMDSLSDSEKQALIEKYPKLAEEDLYILNSSAQSSSKSNIETQLAKVGYTEEVHEELRDTYFPNLTDSAKCVFNVDMIYHLEGNDLLVEIPYDTIRYEDDFPITAISVLPVFGAAGLDEEGFMLVPEGGGAIINLNNGKEWQNGYTARLYGWDYAQIRNEAIQEPRSDFALFGMAKNGGSFLCFIEEGASYGSVYADVSLKRNPPMSYNLVYARYTALHTDEYDLDQEKQGTVVTYEKQLPSGSIVHRYRFLETEDYVEMALAYGDYLRETGMLDALDTVPDDLPVNVEIVSSINKKVVKAGVPVDSVIPTTTFKQSEDIIKQLKNEGGFTNFSVRLTGWANGGLNQSVLTSVSPEGGLGGKKGLKSLIKTADEAGAVLYLDGIHCFAYDSDVFDGFLPYSDAARYVTREQVKLYPYSPASYQPDEEKDVYYLVKPSLAVKTADELIAYLGKNGASGIAFRDIGLMLSADYNQKDIVTREQVKALNVDTLKKAQSSGLKVMVKQGSDYVLGNVNMITDMNLKGTGYSIIDKTIPFYEIAIHSAVSYTGKPVNLASDYVGQLLSCAEYGAGLNFTFMYEDTKVLQDTVYSGFYAASYQRWKEDMLSMAARYQKEMAGLNSKRIVGHEFLTADVTKTVYEDGTFVLVNYSEADYEYNGSVVPARDYAVVREG
ncbi:MAG: hypothetical protein II875_08270 [Clostridia bacterium]|nr:hypothetical protein [Clostridia bacterium]